MENKVAFGLRNVHIALGYFDDDNRICFGRFRPVKGAVTLSLDAEGGEEKFSADDMVYWKSVNNNGYAGDIEFALFPLWVKEAILKEFKDEKGVLFENADVETHPFAMAYEIQGDQKAGRYIFYNCTMSRPSAEHETTEETKTPKTSTASITALPLPNGLTHDADENLGEGCRIVKAATTEETDPEVYNNWFKKVHKGEIYDDEEPDTLKKLVINKDGSGDYRTLAKALGATRGGTKETPVNIDIYPGTYDMYEELGGASWLAGITASSSEMQGLKIPPYTNLNGIGSGVWIKGEMPESITKVQSTKISTLNIEQTTVLKNIKVSAKNMRYAVHDESSNMYPNMSQTGTNSSFLHLGNATGLWEYPVAWASGTSSGVVKTFTNCTFSGNVPFSVHDNTSQAVGTSITFNQCDFNTTNTNSENPYSVRFGTYLNTGAVSNAVFNGCSLNGIISNAPEGSSTTECRWNITGDDKNSIVPQYVLAGTEAAKRYIRFKNEVVEMKNTTGAVIYSGSRVKKASDGSAVVLTTGDATNNQFYAYCMRDVPAGGTGLFRIAGYMNANQMPTSLNAFSKNARLSDASIIGAANTTSTNPWYAVAKNSTYAKVVGYHTGPLPDEMKF